MPYETNINNNMKKKLLIMTLAGLVFASCNSKQHQEKATETADSTVVDSVQVESQQEKKVEKEVPDMTPKGVDSEDDCYDYDADTRSMKNEQGTIYYRQIEE
ncbi:hypothetical protein SAMN04487852_1216 [Prevotella sp. tf2-5]|nr:hypothetical protein SAMN04487852_1216 [Prevotella sp. tf2-5]